LGNVISNDAWTHDVRSRSPQNQPGAEGAMGEAEDSQAEANDLSGRA